jgi:predicted dehydrogenase
LISRILIVGYGSIGKRHLRIARDMNSLADIRILRHQATNEIPEYANGCFSSIEEAILFAPQVAVIASPSSFHIRTAIALAESGIHLLIEKPLSASLEGVGHLLKICKKQHVVLLTGYNLRFLPSLQYFRELLLKGVIGRVLSVRSEVGQYLPSWRADNDYRQGVSARHELGGGALLELSHDLDYLRWIFGEISWIKATLSRQSSLQIDVEDTAHLTLGFVPKLDGQQLITSINLDFIRHDKTRLCTAIGENGTLRWNGLTGDVSLYEAGSSEWKRLFQYESQRDDSYIAEWKNFIDCVLNHKLPFISGSDGLEVLKIIEGAKRSAKSDGMRFELSYLQEQELDS